MTPPTFSIGDEVLIVGPTITGCKLHAGEKFTISWESNGDYTGKGYPWYPASSLRLVEERPLSPMQVTYNYKPDAYEHGTIQVSCPCGRKAEIAMPAELKIGDWVKRDDLVFQISDVHTGSRETLCFNESNQTWYSSTGLRKLTPEEIEQHLVKDLPSPKDVFESRIVAYCRATNDGNISIHERLSAIEKRLSAIETLQFSQQDAIVHFENRLAFVEKIQRDQDNLMGRAIRDGVAEILDFRRK